MVISVQQIVGFLLILARIAGVFIQAPLLSTRSFPLPAKSALAIWVSLVLVFVTPITPLFPSSLFTFVLALASETAIGFTIGFISNLIFVGIQTAGEIMDMQMGLSVASALDPIFGSVISIIGRLAFYVALIIFICADGHHLLFSALHQSFVLLPAGKIPNFASGALVFQMAGLGALLWKTSIMVAAPIVLLIFLSDFAFGIVSRVAPQVNVFMLGFQVKPSIGLIGFVASLPFIVKYINKLLEIMASQLVLFASAIK